MQYLHGVLDKDQVPQEDLSPRSFKGHLLVKAVGGLLGPGHQSWEGWMMSQRPLLTLQARLCPSVDSAPDHGRRVSEAGGRTSTHASGRAADSGQCP